MRLDYAKNIISVNELAELAEFLQAEEVGKKWLRRLFVCSGNTEYIRPFLSRALPEVHNLITADYEENWWRCACESIELFRTIFEVSTAVELLRVTAAELKETVKFVYPLRNCIVYEFGVNQAKELVQSEVLVGPLDFPNGIPSPEQLIGAIAHEVWHAHQVEKAYAFLRQNHCVLDFERADPLSVTGRGAVYALANILLDDIPIEKAGPSALPVHEAEAHYIQQKVVEVLV